MKFKEYLAETMVTTKRQSIVHFENMKPIDFLEFAKRVLKENNQLKDVSATLKVDGCSMRFGKDSLGQFFLETGRSGPIQKENAFSTYTAAKKDATEEVLERAKHYDDMYVKLKASKIWEDLPNNTKVICEMLYNPMAEQSEDKITFISVPYDKNKLGKVATIIPISIMGDYDITNLYDKSTKEIKIISPKLANLNLKFKVDLSAVNDMDEGILKSLKQADKPLKNKWVAELQSLKDEMAKQILTHPITGKDKLGKEIEGIVIELHGKNYKITTPKFKAEKKAEKLSVLKK
jgi:hypothetical protein